MAAHDITGAELHVGDYVLYSDGRTSGLYLCRILDLNENGVYVIRNHVAGGQSWIGYLILFNDYFRITRKQAYDIVHNRRTPMACRIEMGFGFPRKKP